MNKKQIISDELLAKFLDGKTNAFETERVLDYLNENQENLDDFINIRSAIQMETEYPMEIDLAERMDVVKQHIASSTFNKKTKTKRIYLTSILAAAAMITGVVCLFPFIGDEEKPLPSFVNEQNGRMADSTDAPITPQGIYYDEMADNNADNEPENENKPIEIQPVVPKEESPVMEAKTQYKNTASQTEANFFEVTRPSKKPDGVPYMIGVSDAILREKPETTFDFQWNTNAEKVEATVKDKNGNILITKDITQGDFKLKYADYFQYQDIFWEIKATFYDGETEVERGFLQLLPRNN